MNWKTTLALLLLVGGVVLLFWKGPEWLSSKGKIAPDAGTQAFLDDISPKNLVGVEVIAEGTPRLQLQAPAFGKPLELIGNWPIRKAELDELVKTLTGLKSRFLPIPLEEKADLSPFGLAAANQPVTVKLKLNDRNHTLLIGQPTASMRNNPFTQPTYLRLDDKPELIRLGPDVMELFRRTEEDYRLRRIFPEKVRLNVSDELQPKTSAADRPTAKVTELLDDRVTKIKVESPAGSYTLEKVAELPKEKPLANRSQSDPFVSPVQLAESWRILEPVQDHVDPAKLRSILTAVADLWVDRFLDLDETKLTAGSIGSPLLSTMLQTELPSLAGWKGGVELTREKQDATGLLLSGGGSLLKGGPTSTITLYFQDGTQRVLKIGKVTRTVRKVEEPPMLPGAPPMPPRESSEEWRIAQLGNNPLPFEVKADKLKDIFFTLDRGLSAETVDIAAELRDAKLLHLDSGEVTKIEVARTSRLPLILERTTLEKPGDPDAKKDFRWDLRQPFTGLAESTLIDELLRSVDSLTVGKDEIVPLDKAKDLKALGLDAESATKITLTGDGKPRTLLIGKIENGKVYAKVEGWDRVNKVDDRIFALLDRNARVYRALKLFDIVSATPDQSGRVDQISVKKGSEIFKLQEVPGLVPGWNLTAPVQAKADTTKVGNLAKDLGALQASEFVYDPLSVNEMDRAMSIIGGAFVAQTTLKFGDFGLETPTMEITLNFTGVKKLPPQTLLIGKSRELRPTDPKSTEPKGEVFARFANSTSVFTLPKSVFDTLGNGSLALLPTNLTSGSTDALTSITIQRGAEPAYTLQNVDKTWKLTAPIQGTVDTNLVQPLAASLSSLRVERYEAHSTTDLAKYGLTMPALRIKFTLNESTPKAGQSGNVQAKERTLLIGAAESPDKPNRFAKLDDQPEIFTVSESLFRSADLSVYEMLDRKLMTTNAAFISRVQITSPQGSFILDHATNPWKIDGETFTLDRATLDQFLLRLKELNAEKFADFGTAIPWEKYGLDPASKPITVAVTEDRVNKLEIGKPVDEKQPYGSRYVRVNDANAVAILSGNVAADLSKSKLEFVERDLLKFDPIELQGITRTIKGQTLELKQGATGAWEITKPFTKPADAETMEEIAQRCARMRAEKIVAVDGKDLAKFGLDQPQVNITLELLDARGKEQKRVVKFGKPLDEKKPDGDRYAQVEGSPIIGVLPAPLVRRLLGEPIKFLNRSLASFIAADRIEINREDRKLRFQKSGGWKLKSPVDADAEDESLRDMHDILAQLRADEIVAEKPASLQEYGLDNPEITWKLFMGEKELLSLQIGKREKDDFRRYAKLEKGDLVVLLDRGISSRLDSEFRKRSLGERIDPSQISDLILSTPTGKLTLNKLGPVWLDPTKPEEKWNLGALNELADALAEAQIDAYVKDQDADLASFGLDAEHARTLTIRTGMGGSRTILVGKLDASKRLYAKLPDRTRTEVFVLSERDSARLNKDRADLVKIEKEVLPVPKELKK